MGYCTYPIYVYVIRVVNISSQIITIFAENGTQGYSGGRGSASDAMLNSSDGISLAEPGDFYFADEYNNLIGKVDHV